MAGVPDDWGFSMAPDGFDGFGDEFRHGDVYFVGADVEPGSGEEGGRFVDDVFDAGKAAFALHGGTHGFGEGLAVAGHVDFRDDLDVEQGAVGDEVAQFVFGVVFAGQPGGPVVFGVGELRVFVALDAPCRVVREVEVEGVYFVAGEIADECFDEVGREVVATYVEHEAADAEGGRVFDAAAGDDGCAAMREDELAECLKGVEVSGKAGGGDFDPTVRCDSKCVAFLRDFGSRSGAQQDCECLRRWGCIREGDSGGSGDVFEFCRQVGNAFPAGELIGFHAQGGEGAGARFPFDMGGIGQECDFSCSCRAAGRCDGSGILRFACSYGRGER